MEENNTLEVLRKEYIHLLEQFTETGRILNKRIDELQLKNDQLEAELRFLRAKALEVNYNQPNYYPFWHESQSTPQFTNPSSTNTNFDFIDTQEY